ncbi:MAG: DNA polymerase IV [Planctomycetaceae bacterium]
MISSALGFDNRPEYGSLILHIDMDAFYASVEERDRPEMAGQPLIVGGTPEGRGVVAAANYAVRKFGIYSAMPTATALRLCPQAIVLPVRMSHYAAISRQIRRIFFRYTPLVEPLSLDEAFLDVVGCERLFGTADKIARRIKEEIKAETGLVASVGVAPNKFLAKIASDLEKPDALVVVDPVRVQAFLDPLPVSRLWGVGKVTGQSLQRLGVQTIGQLRSLPLETLRQSFGESGEHFWRLAHGIDDRRVVPDREAKSLSHETTFAADIADRETLSGWLLELTDQVGRRLRRHKRQGRTVQIKVRFADFRTITRSQTLAQPSDVTQELWQAAGELLVRALPRQQVGVRLLGMGVSGFAESRPIQQLLFDDAVEQQHAKQKQLDRVTDAVRERFGAGALGRGRGPISPPKRPESR